MDFMSGEGYLKACYLFHIFVLCMTKDIIVLEAKTLLLKYPQCCRSLKICQEVSIRFLLKAKLVTLVPPETFAFLIASHEHHNFMEIL